MTAAKKEDGPGRASPWLGAPWSRLMRELGLAGARCGKKIRTTIPGTDGHRAGDLLRRDFTAPGRAPQRRRIAQYTSFAFTGHLTGSGDRRLGRDRWGPP
jgi:hypothetical protein